MTKEIILTCVIFHASSVADGDLCSQCAHALSCDQTCERFVCECETNYNGTFCDQSKCLVSTRSSSLASSLCWNLLNVSIIFANRFCLQAAIWRVQLPLMKVLTDFLLVAMASCPANQVTQQSQSRGKKITPTLQLNPPFSLNARCLATKERTDVFYKIIIANNSCSLAWQLIHPLGVRGSFGLKLTFDLTYTDRQTWKDILFYWIPRCSNCLVS